MNIEQVMIRLLTICPIAQSRARFAGELRRNVDSRLRTIQPSEVVEALLFATEQIQRKPCDYQLFESCVVLHEAAQRWFFVFLRQPEDFFMASWKMDVEESMKVFRNELRAMMVFHV